MSEKIPRKYKTPADDDLRNSYNLLLENEVGFYDQLYELTESE